MKKVTLPDGRIGYPDIVEYEITEGPEKGTRLPVPPTYKTHPHYLSEKELAEKGIAYRETSLAYITIIHDYDAYEKLAGFWYSPKHMGGGKTVDRRKVS
jgi:hypothetical protein